MVIFLRKEAGSSVISITGMLLTEYHVNSLLSLHTTPQKTNAKVFLLKGFPIMAHHKTMLQSLMSEKDLNLTGGT